MKGILISFLVFLLTVTFLGSETYVLKESQLIRRVYLDVLGVPPTVDELEWFLVYNKNSYQTAVEEVLNRPQTPLNHLVPALKRLIKEVLLSDQYKLKERQFLSPSERNFILYYQSNVYGDNDKADKQLVLNAIAIGESGIMDPVDYIAENLMARDTTAKEATLLNQIKNRYPSEEEGYLAILREIKTYKDFITK